MQIQNIDENLSMNISDTSGVSLQVSDVDTSLEMNIATNDVINLNIINEEGNISMEVETSGSKVEGTTDHSKLQNLDYAHSGHTGFQPKGDYVEDRNYVHTDNNFTDAQKTKLESLNNYDDTLIKKEVSSNTSQINTLKTSVENKAEKTEIPDVSNFITKTVDDLVNYYKKNETFNKSEIEQFSSEIMEQLGEKANKNEIPSLTGYATEKWVKDQDYMPIPDFQEYINYFHYTKTETDEKFNDYYNKEEINGKDYVTMPDFREVMTTFYYNKEEIDTKLEELPTGGTELTGGDNTVIEDNKINVYTNTGYKVSDKDIQLQSITDSETTGENKIVYIDEKEIVIIYDGTNKIRRSENGIDFDVITLPVECKYMVFNAEYNRLYGTDKSSNFLVSYNTGLTWQTINSTYASGLHQIAIGFGAGFRTTYKTTKEIISWTFDSTNNRLALNSRIKSTIVPEFTEMVNNSQFVWCNSAGTFKYGAGSQEGNFASLSGIEVNLLKRVNNMTILGLKNDNRIYLLERAGSISNYKWVEHTLLDTCTVNDIIYNPYDETYYIFTDINTYYKTKDFVNYESIDKNNLRGIQGSFTLEGIQMTTSNHNELLLAPTRTKQENQNQNFKRLTKKELWVGKGLELEDGRFNVKSNSSVIGVSDYGLYITPLTEDNLSEQVLESLYVAKAQEKDLFDPVEMENWYFSDEAYPVDTNYKAVKFLFSQAGSFINMATWEDEIVVEQYEYGYLFYDVNMTIFKYVKLGNKAWMFN